jgi:ABC-type nickel/cobalt efflux system permease component RcnA
MRRLLIALAALLVLAPAAGAHPLGNFSINHLAVVSAAHGELRVHYVLDQAEIPTFQERGTAPATVLARKRAEIAGGVTVTADGRRVPLTATVGTIAHRPGQGGLSTTRVELDLVGRAAPRSSVRVTDATFPGRVGWKAVLAAGQQDPTHGLTAYPKAVLSSPSDVRAAAFRVRAGAIVAPHTGAVATTGDRSGDSGFTKLFDDAAAGHGVLLLLLLAAFGWGALHALSPGHGKAMVAAYLVGTRGTARHAVALGATVTVTHTAGVFALGLVTLALSAYVLPEDLYPWLNLTSALLVLGVGAAVLRARRRQQRVHAHHHKHGDHHHDHDHRHDDLSAKSILAMGASAGLIPCPSALVVLLGAVAQHEVALGLLLITAFSLGLAATLTGLGILVVRAARVPLPPRAAALVPVLSAALIVIVGVVMTVKALPPVIRS